MRACTSRIQPGIRLAGLNWGLHAAAARLLRGEDGLCPARWGGWLAGWLAGWLGVRLGGWMSMGGCRVLVFG
jgi:hypothetical protein